LDLSSKVQGGSDNRAAPTRAAFAGQRARRATTLAGVPGPALLRELSRTEFLSELDTLLAVYAAAMLPDPAYLPGRLSIMERHAAHPAFQAIVATASPVSQIVAFGYGFRGADGQWWHDVVGTGITATSGPGAAAAWLADAMEIAEVHVRPEFQHQGIGRRLLLALTAGRAERTAVLSTQDIDSPARHLYRSLGFADLLTGFSFPGGGPPYAVMGATLPLRGSGQAASQSPGSGRSADRGQS
jgi:ribosomal protein S18 acetylase RimI-like enzyme